MENNQAEIRQEESQGFNEHFAYFRQSSSFGPYIECKADDEGAFKAFRQSAVQQPLVAEVWQVCLEHVTEDKRLVYLVDPEVPATFPSPDLAVQYIKDHELPIGWVVRQLTLSPTDTPVSDGVINEITKNVLGHWPTFQAQSWACKVVHAVLANILSPHQFLGVPVLERVPYQVGNLYQTQAGDWVRFVSVHNEGTSYESMADEQGCNRYTRRDFGRVTGSAHDYSHPDNTPQLFRIVPRGYSKDITAAESVAPQITASDIVKKALRIDWLNTETQARHVAEYAESLLKPSAKHERMTAAEIANKALGIDWYDTESQARRVAECAEELLAASVA